MTDGHFRDEDDVIEANQNHVRSDCQSIAFKNQGSTVAKIGSIVLNAGESYSSAGLFRDDVNVSTYNVTFTGAGTNSLLVVRRFYKGVEYKV